MARPKKAKYRTKYMVEKIEEYIQQNKKSLPILKECCLENDWNYDYIMELQRNDPLLSQSIKKLLAYKEVQLEKGMISGRLNVTACIFSLKQPAFGWTDKAQSEVNINIQEKNHNNLVKALVQLDEGENDD